MASPAAPGRRSKRDDATKAGTDAAAILTAAEKTIVTAMTSAATAAIRGTVPPALARRKVRIAAAAALGAASSRLLAVYDRAVKGATGETGPLPDAPGQVATAILRAQQDADVAFSAVLAAAGVKGSRMPAPSSPYRRIVTKAAQQPVPGRAAAAAIDAITVRGLTGYTSPAGRRQQLGAYAQRAVRRATSWLAAMPVMAEVTARRQQLDAVHTQAVAAAWHQAVSGLDTGDAVGAYRRDPRVAGAGQQSPGLPKRWRQEAARAALLAWLSRIYQSGRYVALVAALEAAVRDGMAEGEADALAMAAHRQGLGPFDIGAAFRAARVRLADDTGAARAAQDAADRLINGAVADAARVLATAAADASAADLAAAVAAAILGQDISAVGRWTEEALWEAFGAGAVDLYRRASGLFAGQGVEIDWLTDSSPCARCQENADGSPYTPYDVPAFPGHPHCRCNLASQSVLPVAFLRPFLAQAA